MPLEHGKSKKAFEHNLKAELHAGKPKDQSLAIAYSVKRKAKSPKKMADGGPVSAKTESRPMPETEANDHHDVARAGAKKALTQSSWTDSPTMKQSMSKGMSQPISHPKMVPTNAFSTRLYNKEGKLEDSAKPSNPKDQPEADMNEKGPNRKGPMSHDLKLKMMAKGGMLPAGSEDDMVEHPAGLEEDDDEMSPAESEFMAGKVPMLADGGDVDEDDSITEDPEYGEASMVHHKPEPEEGGKYAEGGSIHHEMDEQPEPEEDDEHYSSITASIMARRAKMHEAIDSGSHDEDMAEADMMAEGGEVDLSENADESPNNEDQMSFDALKKESYSETPGLNALDSPEDSNEHGHELSDEDANDMVSKMRSKMMARRQFRKD